MSIVPHSQDWTEATAPGKAPILTSIYQCSSEFLGQLKLWMEQAGLNLPISNIVGFQQFTSNHAEVATRETTTSATYANLATTGPEITELPPGSYVILFGCGAFHTVVNTLMFISVDVNGAGAADADGARADSKDATAEETMSRAIVKTLDLDSNTLTMKYRTAAATASFENRWIIALRYANP